MQHSFVIVENFFRDAEGLRSAFEAHFRNPQIHSPIHQVWNYWYVPELYTYLRTDPKRILPEPLLAQFLQHLNAWVSANLGLTTRSSPWLSLYVNGCGQGLHNDSLNGQMGYVYSLTRWQERCFLGGETILFRPENYWETERIKAAGAGASFYDKVPTRFNQLLIFDDRVIHGVQPVQGTMDPLSGRVVIHGHLKAEELILNGALSGDAVLAALPATLEKIRTLASEHSAFVHGFMTVRLAIQPGGRVASVRCLWDRLLPLTPDKDRLIALKQRMVQLLSELLFPSANGPSELTLPVLVGS
jgi:hypothetical protein